VGRDKTVMSGDRLHRPAEVVVGHDERVVKIAAGGDADRGRTHPTGADEQDSHADHSIEFVLRAR
jgi:hypothetical protein